MAAVTLFEKFTLACLSADSLMTSIIPVSHALSAAWDCYGSTVPDSRPYPIAWLAIAVQAAVRLAPPRSRNGAFSA
jgi:hypothetical protein